MPLTNKYICDGQMSIFDLLKSEPKTTPKGTMAYPCSDCTEYQGGCIHGIDPRKCFCKEYKSKLLHNNTLPDKFCFDDDINEILLKLQNLCISQRFTLDKPKFEIWDHVKNLGYRLSLSVHWSNETKPRADFFPKYQKIVKYAKEHEIELSLCQSPYFGNSHFTGTYWFSTMYLDKRKKIKEDSN